MTSAEARPARRARQARPASRYALAVAGTGAIALAFGLWLGGATPGQAGDTAWGLALSRLAVDAAAVGTIGMLVTCVLLPRAGGALTEPARRCLYSTGWLALAWAVTAVALLLLSWSDVTGLPVSRLPYGEVLIREGGTFPEATSYLFGAVLATVIAAGAAVTGTVRDAAVLLLLSGYNLLPLTTVGHAEHSAAVGLAVTVHVVAMALWVGGLTGLLVHVRRAPRLLAVAVPRFSRLALACFVVVGGSGLVTAWLNLESLPELWRSRYGLIVLCKVTALATLGTFGWWHRRRTVPAVVTGRSARPFVRLAAVEVAVMIATVSLGVALARTPPPAPAVPVMETHAAAHS